MLTKCVCMFAALVNVQLLVKILHRQLSKDDAHNAAIGHYATEPPTPAGGQAAGYRH